MLVATTFITFMVTGTVCSNYSTNTTISAVTMTETGPFP